MTVPYPWLITNRKPECVLPLPSGHSIIHDAAEHVITWKKEQMWFTREDCVRKPTQNYCTSGLCPSSRILNIRKCNISETWSVSILRRRGGGTPAPLSSIERANLNRRATRVKVQVQLWPMVSWPVRLGVADFNFLCLTVTFVLLHVRCPLWWEDESVNCSEITHWLELLKTHNHILLSCLRLPQPQGPGLRIYIPQEQGGPVIPWKLGSFFVASYDSQGYGGGILTHLQVVQSDNPCHITTAL
jgi:hypothetical protein